MRKKVRFGLIQLLVLISAGTFVSAQSISLAGDWRFRIDRKDAGLQEQWFNQQLEYQIKLPGSMLTNYHGDDVTLETSWTGSIYDSSWFFNPKLEKYRQPGNLKFPFWLTPARYYKGAAWYQKDVTIPANWKGQHVELFLERCHTETTVWVDGKELGMQNSLVAPHVYDLSALGTPGKHTITIRIDNRIKEINVGPDSHSLTDHTQGNWNGIIGKIALIATPPVWINNVQVYPDINRKEALVQVQIKSAGSVAGKITINAGSLNLEHTVPALNRSFAINGDTILQITLPMTEHVLLWDEFNPVVYWLKVKLLTTGKISHEKELRFGMREIKIQGNTILLNGHPVFMRGTVNNCEFPLTGYPPMDIPAWIKLFTTAKSYGLNHMRFHSWCPPSAAFEAADLLGFYLQPEGPGWVNHGTSLGDGRPVDQYMYDETNRMAFWYGSYASFCMEAVGGNEPAGRNQSKFLASFVQYWHAKDKRRVYTGASVGQSWPLVPENEYMVKAGARGLSWPNQRPESDSDYHVMVEKFPVPYIAHEMGQYCVFPDFNEIPQYTGVYKAKNFELFREELAAHDMGDKAQAFLMASGKLQVLCYKHEIEKSMRTKSMAGFQLLGLPDFPGQGTALVGMVNALWQPKPYVNSQEVRRFCNAVVPLIRINKFVFTNDETLSATVELFNYGRGELKQATITWKLKDSTGKVIAKGVFDPIDYPIGNCIPVGTIQYPLYSISSAMRLNLEVALANTAYNNNWNLFVFPAALPEVPNPAKVYYCDSLDATALNTLQNGGTIFMQAAGKIMKGKEIVNYFTPVFWNTSWFKMRPPHTTGFVCDPKHPAFKNFPTEDHSDMHWWEIVNRAQVMHLEDFPKGFQPVLQPIDTWFMNRKLAFILETRVGKGKLLMCSIDLKKDLDKRPAARQLLYSLQSYVQSDAFQPAAEVPLSAVQALFTEPSRDVWSGYTKSGPDELRPKVN